MTDYSFDEVVYIDLCVTKLPDNKFIAGADFKKRDENGKHHTFKVASLYIDNDDIDSNNKAIVHVLFILLDEIPPGTKLVKIKGNNSAFYKRRQLEGKIVRKMAENDFKVTVWHKRDLLNKNHNIALLANDALKRKSSVIADV